MFQGLNSLEIYEEVFKTRSKRAYNKGHYFTGGKYDDEYYICSDSNGVTYIVFDGSSEPKEWASNMDIDLVDHPVGGLFHEGFLDSFKTMADDLFCDFVDYYSHGDIIIITYSRGGPIGIQAGLDILLLYNIDDHRNLLIETIACPNYCDEECNSKLAVQFMSRAEIRNIVCYGDIVTKLPKNMTKVGELIKIGRRWWQYFTWLLPLSFRVHTKYYWKRKYDV